MSMAKELGLGVASAGPAIEDLSDLKFGITINISTGVAQEMYRQYSTRYYKCRAIHRNARNLTLETTPI